jgi:hypothetical protein
MNDKSHKFGYELLELCVDIDVNHKTEIYCGQVNDHKFWKIEEPDMGASNLIIQRQQDMKIRYCILIDIINPCICLNRQKQCIDTAQ